MNKLTLEELKDLWLNTFETVTQNKSLSVLDMMERYSLFKKRLVASGNCYKIVARAEKEAEEQHHISLMKVFINERHSSKMGVKSEKGN